MDINILIQCYTFEIDIYSLQQQEQFHFCLWNFEYELNKGDLIALAAFGGGFTGDGKSVEAGMLIFFIGAAPFFSSKACKIQTMILILNSIQNL